MYNNTEIQALQQDTTTFLTSFNEKRTILFDELDNFKKIIR